MNKILLSLLVLSLVFVGCHKPFKLQSETYKKFELVEIDPPKRFYVTLKDVETGEIFIEYVSKRCSSYDRNKIGDINTIKVLHYVNEDGETYDEFADIYNIFCK